MFDVPQNWLDLDVDLLLTLSQLALLSGAECTRAEAVQGWDGKSCADQRRKIFLGDRSSGSYNADKFFHSSPQERSWKHVPGAVWFVEMESLSCHQYCEKANCNTVYFKSKDKADLEEPLPHVKDVKVEQKKRT